MVYSWLATIVAGYCVCACALTSVGMTDVSVSRSADHGQHSSSDHCHEAAQSRRTILLQDHRLSQQFLAQAHEGSMRLAESICWQLQCVSSALAQPQEYMSRVNLQQYTNEHAPGGSTDSLAALGPSPLAVPPLMRPLPSMLLLLAMPPLLLNSTLDRSTTCFY